MHDELDHGARCSSHTGEAFRVRCYACDAAAAEALNVPPVRVSRYIPDSECRVHRGWPVLIETGACDRCAQIDLGVSS